MRKIKLTQGYFSLVDDDDYDFVNKFKWHICKNKNNIYAVRAVYENGYQRKIFMHNFLIGKSTVDHKNRNGLDNRRSNLRECTRSQNQMNKKPSGESKYLGVSRKKGRIKWTAKIMQKHLGYFDTEIQAARAYDKAAKVYHKQFANLNFKTK